MPEQRLLRTKEVAEILGVHPETVRRRADELGAIRLNTRVTRYPSQKVERYIQSHSQARVAL